jgi:hypothetical protein
MALYYQAFGWAPWQVFDHLPPVHHNTQLRGQDVYYSLRGAEVYVGRMNFELLQPLEGPNLWTEHIERRGEGIASIATMFLEREDGDAVKRAFDREFGIPVTMKADIGDHIEYYYLGTEDRFGCLIESGSGHAIDFVKPALVYPTADAKPGSSPMSGISYALSQVTLVVRDLEGALEAYHRAFGWGPWKVYEAGPVRRADVRGSDANFAVCFAQTLVGDLNFEIMQPLDETSPYAEYLRSGEGLAGISVRVLSEDAVERAAAQFKELGVGVLASGTIKGPHWLLLDSVSRFKCLIGVTVGHAFQTSEPTRIWPE